MKIVIATPLYPPDIAEPAPYAKQLAKYLSKENDITIILFGRLPEQIPGVKFIAIDKRKLLPLRLTQYFFALLKNTKKADILYVLDGSSVELTASLFSFLKKIPIIVYSGDKDANDWVQTKPILLLIKKLMHHRAKKVITLLPPPKPEILPYQPYPTAELNTYQQAWVKHLEYINSLFVEIKK